MNRSQRINVLHIIEGLGTGGAERQLTAFILRSDPTRFRHEVCTLSTEGRFAADLRRANIPVYALGVVSDGNLAQSIVRLGRVVRRVDPSIIHATLYRPGVVSRIVGRLCGKPVVTTLVNTTYEPEWRLDNEHLKPYKVWLARKADELTSRWWGTWFVAISESVRSSAVRQLMLPMDRISVIPRGLVFNEMTEGRHGDATVAPEALGWSDAYPVILNVGRLVPQKGQQYAIRAMQRVVSKFPSAHLAIAGEGSLRPMLEHLIRSLELERSVTLLGERHDVGLLLQMADIFVFPSLFEGLGNALLEAMAAGKACVASRIPSLRELTRDGSVALLVGLQSPEDVAAALLRLAEDRGFSEQLGRAARVWARAHYDIRQIVTALEALYERLATSSLH